MQRRSDILTRGPPFPYFPFSFSFSAPFFAAGLGCFFGSFGSVKFSAPLTGLDALGTERPQKEHFKPCLVGLPQLVHSTLVNIVELHDTC